MKKLKPYLFALLFPGYAKQLVEEAQKLVEQNQRIQSLQADALELKYHLSRVCSCNRAEANRWRRIIKENLLKQ
jgi:hypothetical protein